MAVFGRDFYGLTKYGASVYADFDVNPFDANPEGYGAIRITWHAPAGQWNQLRLLRSRSGYSVDENDGAILVDSISPVDHYFDADLSGGYWYYYTLFIKGTNGVWNRAGATSSMAVSKAWGDVGHTDLMWDRIPPYFRYFRKDNRAAVTDEYFFPATNAASVMNPDLFDQENPHLRAFVGVLGWGLDWLHNYQATLLSANDPKKAHLSDVDRLASELGIEFEYSVPAQVMRSKVANAALLARRRGTVDGLQDVAALSTGWDVDIQVGPNLMLNRDQASFANPTYNEWNPGINYAVGQKVQYEGRIFTARVGAYGDAQRPPTTGVNSNTWWTVTTDVDVTNLHRADTQGVVTWKGFTDGTLPKTLSLAIGVSDPISGVNQESNALAIRNTDTAAHTYDVVGASNLYGDAAVLPHPSMVIRQGLPIPRAMIWDPTVEYDLGVLVQHNGATWRAIGTSYGQDPATSTTYWEKVGVDSRPVLAYSFYGHGPLSGSTGAVAVTPGLSFYDQQGGLLLDQVTATPLTNFLFDTFNHTFGTPDYGTGAWTTTKTWTTESVGRGDDFVAYPLGGTGTAYHTSPSGLTQYRVAVTFSKAPAPGRTDSLALRYVDANNYMRVTRTKVQKRVSGTLTDVATLTRTINDGDRVVVSINDTTNTFTVFVNGTQAATGALTGGTSPYRHGMMVE